MGTLSRSSAFLTRGQDDRVENCYHKEFSDPAEYGVSFRGNKIPCGSKDQARVCHSGKKWGLRVILDSLNSFVRFWVNG